MNITRAMRDRLIGGMTAAAASPIIIVPAAVYPGAAPTTTGVDLAGQQPDMTVVLNEGGWTGSPTGLTVQLQQSASFATGYTNLGALQTFTAPDHVAAVSVHRTQRYMRAMMTVSPSGLPKVVASGTWTPAIAPALPAGAMTAGLYSALVDHGLDTVYADVTIPTLGPANPQTVTAWSAAANLADGRGAVRGTRLRFAPANAAAATTVFGWFWASTDASPILLAWEPLTAPIAMPNESYAVYLMPFAGVDPASWWGRGVVIDD